MRRCVQRIRAEDAWLLRSMDYPGWRAQNHFRKPTAMTDGEWRLYLR